MGFHSLFNFIEIIMIFFCIVISQSSDVQPRRRKEDGSCINNNECYRHEKCQNNKCTDGCDDIVCGRLAWCQVIDHISACICPPGYIGDPNTSCLGPYCESNEDCYESETCEKNECVDACNTIFCGENARCKTKNHNPICFCEPGLTGNPLTECVQRNCTTSNDCYHFEMCENEKCFDTCNVGSCGANAWCGIKNHSIECTCAEKYTGDPYSECARGKCTSHDDCYSHERCENNSCIDPCESMTCGENAWCKTEDHDAVCNCEWDFFGDPLVKCEERTCTTNSDCDHSEQCHNTECVSACTRVLCGENAWCNITDHNPYCSCIEGYIGDPNSGCVRSNCSSNNNCHSFEKCMNEQCIPVCGSDTCGQNTFCKVKDHKAECECMSGYIGDPFTKCTEHRCVTNDDCSISEKCHYEKCINACEEVFCGFDMLCKVKDHVPICSCGEKHSGDIHNGCVRQSCSANTDCFEYEKCEKTKCIPACDSSSCPKDAICSVKNNVAVCTWQEELTGNPVVTIID